MKSFESLVRVHTHTHTQDNLKEEKRVDKVYSKSDENRSLLSKLKISLFSKDLFLYLNKDLCLNKK